MRTWVGNILVGTSSPASNSSSVSSGMIVLLHYRKIAAICGTVHFFNAFLSLFFSVLAPKSNQIAVACGILAILACLTPLFYVLFASNFKLVFSCLIAFNLSPIWFLYLEGVLPGYDAYEYIQAQNRMEGLFWVSIFLFFINFLYAAFWRVGSDVSVKSFAFLREVNLTAKFYTRLAIVAFVVPLVAFYIFYDSIDTLWLAMTGGRSNGGGDGLLIRSPEGDSSSLMLPFVWLWQLTPLLASIGFILAKRKERLFAVVPSILGLFVIFIFFLSGTRSSMMLVSAPVLFFLCYYNWDRGLKFWIGIGCLFFALIAVMEIQLRFRAFKGNLLQVISNPTASAREAGYESITTFDPTKTQRDNNFYLFCLIIKRHPEKAPFDGFNDFYAVILNPIPRYLWPGKPMIIGSKDLSYQPQFVLDGPLDMGTTSLSYSLVGEAYLANGLFGLLFYSFVYALFLLFFDGLIFHSGKKQPLTVGVLGFGVFLGFWGFRAFVALITFLYPLILFILLMRLVAVYLSLTGKRRPLIKARNI